MDIALSKVPAREESKKGMVHRENASLDVSF